MSIPADPTSKARRTLMLLAFIALAAWGGWGLAKMGDARSRAKAEAESARVAGVGEVRERPEPVAPAPPVVVPAPIPAPAPVVEVVAPEPAEPAPAVLLVRTVPFAEVWVTAAGGAARLAGKADAAGVFSTRTLPPGPCAVEVRHADYRPMTPPVAVSPVAGETVERLIVPEAKPGAIILLTDEGVVAHLDGKKVGGYAVMLGGVPSRRELPLRLVMADGTTRETTVKLAPRESRLLDLRSPAKAKGDIAPEGLVTNIPSPTPVSKAPALPAAAPVKLAVRVISVAPETGLIALADAEGGPAPLANGATGSFSFAGVAAPVKVACVRTFGGVSVCRAEKLPAGEAPVSGELVR